MRCHHSTHLVLIFLEPLLLAPVPVPLTVVVVVVAGDSLPWEAAFSMRFRARWVSTWKGGLSPLAAPAPAAAEGDNEEEEEIDLLPPPTLTVLPCCLPCPCPKACPSPGPDAPIVCLRFDG